MITTRLFPSEIVCVCFDRCRARPVHYPQSVNMEPFEKTYAMIKPDALRAGKAEEICQLIEVHGFTIIAKQKLQVCHCTAPLSSARRRRCKCKASSETLLHLLKVCLKLETTHLAQCVALHVASLYNTTAQQVIVCATAHAPTSPGVLWCAQRKGFF